MVASNNLGVAKRGLYISLNQIILADNTRSVRGQRVGEDDHLKVFATEDAANAWFAEHNPEGVAFEHPVKKRELR
jgi:hypothetical protein